MNDLEELAALNRQIAELRSVLDELVSDLDWWTPATEYGIGECHYCYQPAKSVGYGAYSCDHTSDCPYRRAEELAADADKDTR